MEKTALITGASSGLGIEFAKLCLREKRNVIVVAKDGKKLTKVAAMLRSENTNTILPIVKDLSVPNAGRELYEEVRSLHGNIDILINNAGFAMHGIFSTLPLDEDINQIMVNVTALTVLTKLFSQDMLRQKYGRILNIASQAAFLPGPFMAVYYATKAYVLSFSEALAEELHGSGVTVSVLCPGPTNTGFAKRAHMENSPLFSHGMDASTVARKGYDGMMKGKRRIIPGFINTIQAKIIPFIPQPVLLAVVKSLQPINL